MPLFSRAVFSFVRFAARRGLAESQAGESAKENARRTGIRGETFAYWYLRRHGYVFVARNYRILDDKGEIDLVGYDGSVLAFVEVKTRSGTEEHPGQPEEAVTSGTWNAWRKDFWLSDEFVTLPGGSIWWRLRAAPGTHPRFVCTKMRLR